MSSEFIPVCEPSLNGNEIKYVNDAISTGWISSQGKYVSQFEEMFAEYCDVKYAVSVCNGTAALHLALVALGIGKGDEVIIPNFTMSSCAFAVCYTGAMPVFVDARSDTWNINEDEIESKITIKTKAIMPVHIFGNPCNMDAIRKVAEKHNLLILEDAAEAHGAEYRGSKVGSMSDVAAFSLYSNKNLTTGEGGLAVTDSEEVYKNLLYYKNVCFSLDGPRDYRHHDIGFNYRMSNIHAAIGLAQVEKADEYRSLRIKNSEAYKEYLQNVEGISFPVDQLDSVNVKWMNGILIDPEKFGRGSIEIMEMLREKGIDSRRFFVGMHQQPSLEKYGCTMTGDYSVTEKLTKNGFYLPSSSNLPSEKIKYISETLISLKK
ncbi:MAG: DegT/DnrJ/EryC1/StrS family aminotransferase [Bacteriovoracaceae bacterium]|jgi:perosamine synthetase|nr:DegT/DnrJ/EryC1/StrS family aminotransferase [Bacteriovoracaceae bacterium]